MSDNFPHRGEVYFASLDPVFGSEQGGQRPVLIIQNDLGNRYSSIVIVASITSAPPKKRFQTDVIIQPGVGGRTAMSRIQLNQIRTLDKRRLGRYIAQLTDEQIAQVDEAIKISLGLVSI
jgi:mRNA interferase MazF